eukprot:80084_1
MALKGNSTSFLNFLILYMLLIFLMVGSNYFNLRDISVFAGNQYTYKEHEIHQYNLAECPTAGTNITFITSSIERQIMLRHKHPPLLISFGGSGNTFVRLLIEYMTKIYTGSIYKREFYGKGFHGSGRCLTDVIVSKIHGEHMSQDSLELLLNDECIYPCFCKSQRKHLEVEEINTVAAIFVMRNPWDAMFALYNYQVGGNSIKQEERVRHTAHVPLNKWIASKFEKWLMRHQHPMGWKTNVKIMMQFEKMNKSFLVIKFENIVHPNMNIRSNELLKLAKYVYSEQYFKDNQDLLKYRIQCIWNISQTDHRMESIHRSKPNKWQLNKTHAYNSLSDKSICRIWNEIRPYAAALGYSNWNNISCS